MQVAWADVAIKAASVVTHRSPPKLGLPALAHLGSCSWAMWEWVSCESCRSEQDAVGYKTSEGLGLTVRSC